MIGGYIKYRRRLSEDDFWFAHIPINFRQLSPSELSEPMVVCGDSITLFDKDRERVI